MTADNAEFGAALTIDLNALVDNWRSLALCAPRSEIGAVVKADAYGCGIEHVVPALERAGCATFFVAHLSEARRLRKVSAGATVYVLNGLLPGTAGVYRTIDARPVLGSPVELTEWAEQGFGGLCAVHVDTGMNRLGLSMGELNELAEAGAHGRLNPSLIMTHFSASEDHAASSNARQIKAFAEVAELFSDVPKSLLNSSGHFLDMAPAYELTRPGFALYGGNPVPGSPNPMQPVVRLTARILQTRVVEDGAPVGYNGRWHAKGRRKLATISVGYADGYARNASATDGSPGGHAVVGGVICPFAGMVSMDLIVIDVSDAPPGSTERGAEVLLIGDALDIETVAASARTVGYEMLTSLGKRYQRSYVGS